MPGVRRGLEENGVDEFARRRASRRSLRVLLVLAFLPPLAACSISHATTSTSPGSRTCAPSCASQTSPSAFSPSESANPKAIPTTRTVAWNPLASTPTPLPTVTARPCRVADLQASVEMEGATQSLAGPARFTNVSGTVCWVSSRPEVTLIGPDGRTLPVEVRGTAAGKRWPTEPIAVIPPREAASAFMVWRNWCGKPVAPVTWRLRLAGVGRFVVRGPAAGPVCNSPGPSSLSVTEVVPMSATEGSPKWPLVPVIRQAVAAASGADLRYVVILFNAGGPVYRFPHDCPAYEERVHLPDGRSIGASYTLDCRAAGLVPTGMGVGFEMVLHVPRDARPGVGRLTWALDPPWGLDREVPVTIGPPA